MTIPAEPGGDDVGAVAGLERDDDAGHDLDHSDQVHRGRGAAGDDVVDPGRQVDLPVDQDVEELVEAEDDRRDGEGDPQQQERLVGGVALEAFAERRATAVRPRAGREWRWWTWGLRSVWLTAVPVLRVSAEPPGLTPAVRNGRRRSLTMHGASDDGAADRSRDPAARTSRRRSQVWLRAARARTGRGETRPWSSSTRCC